MEKLLLSNSTKSNLNSPHASDAPDVPEIQTKGNPVSPKKLLLSKWTAVTPQHKEKHFLVTSVVTPEIPGAPITEIDLEAAMTGRTQRMPWRELKDASKWKRGWV